MLRTPGPLIDRRGLLQGGLALAAGVIPQSTGAAPASRVWTFDNRHRVGAHHVTLVGAPTLVASPWGPALSFDGIKDGLFVDEHPLAGAATFTFEVLFRPDGGAHEQRWFHLEAEQTPPAPPGKSESRMLFELRVADCGWYLDAFMTGPGYRQALMAPAKTFAVGAWYHVAQTYDGQTYRSFVDGELQTEAIVPFVAQGPGRASVGVRLNQVNFFRGAVRQARFSSMALAPWQFGITARK